MSDETTVLKDTSDHDVIAIETSGPEGEVLLEVDHVTLEVRRRGRTQRRRLQHPARARSSA